MAELVFEEAGNGAGRGSNGNRLWVEQTVAEETFF